VGIERRGHIVYLALAGFFVTNAILGEGKRGMGSLKAMSSQSPRFHNVKSLLH
jgi:hypothetical protein